MTIDLSTLNAAQRDGVLFTEGPVLIIAGPGAGKTATLTRRIARLVEERLAHPSEILAVTFTNKAASEMKERLEGMLGSQAHGLWVSTFHSLGVRILRQDAHRLGWTRNFTIYDADDAKRLIKRLMKEAGYEEGYAKPSAVASIISKAKNDGTEPTDFGGGPAERVAVEMFGPYNEALKQANAFDFDDLLGKTYQLFREFPEVLFGYQERFRYVLVDEYQDTNPIQDDIARMLAGKRRNIMVVGDEGQCHPAGTPVLTPAGYVPIESIRPGDEVVAGVGLGEAASVKVGDVGARDYEGTIVRVRMEGGHTITATPDHLIPARMDLAEHEHLVYLMYRRGYGYRIGRTSRVRANRSGERTDGLQVRMNQELADRAWVLEGCNTAAEASYWESFYAATYGLPTAVFHVPPSMNTAMRQDDVDRLFRSIPTAERAERLLAEHHLTHEHPHRRSGAVVRNGITRRNVNVTHLGSYRSRPQVVGRASRIIFQTTGDDIRNLANRAGFCTKDGGRGTWAVETERTTMERAKEFAERLAGIYPGISVVEKIRLTAGKPLLFFPAGSLRKGMVVAVLSDQGDLVEDRVLDISSEHYDGTVYSLSVPGFQNYITDGVAVKNCIYGFRGSKVEHILSFTERYPEAVTIKLERNYRSTGHIVKAVNALIANNETGLKKDLYTELPDGHKVLGMVANDDRDEAWKVVREMERLMREERLDYSDFAVFYRTNAQSRQIEDAFLKSGTPYKIVGGTRYFDRAEVRDLMAYLKVLVNPADGISLRRIVNVPRRGIGDTSLNKLDAWARERGWTLWQAMEETALGMGPLPKRATESIYEFTRLIDGMRKAAMPREGQVDVAVAVQAIIEKTGMVEAYEALGDNESLGRAENVAEFLNVAIEFGSSHPEATLADFVEWLALRTDLDEVEEGASHAVLMTVHTAKGLEFPCVFVTGLEEEVFPHINSINEGAAQLEEERRLAYVALSRAERHLVLLRARQRMSFGQIRYNKPSRFLAEIPPECLEAEEGFAGGREAPAGVFGGGARSGASRGWRGGTSRQGTGTGSSLPRPAAAPKPAAKPAEHWAKGTRVRHKAFGLGTVTVAGTDSVEVRFDDGSRKKLMPAYAPMERIS